jgi:hypothetical protein
VSYSETLFFYLTFLFTLLRDFAANAGIQFHTPEEYFLHEDRRTFVREFDPTVFLHEKAMSSTTASKYWDGQPHGAR